MRFLLGWIFTLWFGIVARAQDWPQWLGPERNGAIAATIPPWKDKLEVAWKAPVGEGHSSPIVADGRVYLHSKAAGIDEEVLTCWDLSGKQLWQSSYPRGEFKARFGAGPRATPCVADGKLYSLGVTGLLICWDAASGNQLWKVNLLEQFAAKNLFFGISSSPMVVGKYLYVMPGGPKASVVALDKETGIVAWQTGSDAATYASPMVTTIGDKQVVVFLTREGLVGMDDKTGKEYFRVPLHDALNESSTTPVRVGDLLVASSVTFGSLAAKVGVHDGQPVATQEWKEPKLTCYFGTPVEFGGLLYLVTGRIISPTATLHCVDPKTGKVLWSKAGVGKYHATLLRSNDKVLMLEEGGDLVMLDPNKETYKELARAKVCRNTWAHPGWANGLFIIRDEQELIAVKLPKAE